VGGAAGRGGDVEEARTLWRRLLQVLPDDSPERGEIERRLDGLG